MTLLLTMISSATCSWSECRALVRPTRTERHLLIQIRSLPPSHSKLGFDPTISTHKMNPNYRSPRWSTTKLLDLVREKVMIEKDVPGALEEISQ